MQRRRRRRRCPGGVRPGPGMRRSSAPACRPSGPVPPTSPCRSAPAPTARTPDRWRRSAPHRRAIHFDGLDVGLAHHRPGLHRRVDLVAGAIEEAGVDEDDPVLHRVDAGRQIGAVRRSSSITPTLIVCRFSPSRSSTASNRRVGERRLVRPVHLRLDDIDRPGARVGEPTQPLEIVASRSATSRWRPECPPAPPSRPPDGSPDWSSDVRRSVQRAMTAPSASPPLRSAPSRSGPAPASAFSVFPPFWKLADRSPFISPSQLR